MEGERRAYLNGVQDMIAGLDDARVVLGQALQRARRERGGKGERTEGRLSDV
jgi:hypothetical protein